MIFIHSTEEASERREERESRDSGRFGNEFRDTEEMSSSSKRHEEKEFRFDSAERVVEKQKPASSKPLKKIDLGAAAFYKGDNNSSVSLLILFSSNSYYHLITILSYV